MTESTFSRIAGELFREVLTVHGFTSAGCKSCTLYRWATADVVHVIRGETNSRGTTFIVAVFPTSPAIDPRFRLHFPDDLRTPTDYYSYLSTEGVGPQQSHFRCREEPGLRRNFTREVQPLLEQFAVPYLNRFRTVGDLVPVIRHTGFLGFALAAVGQTHRARDLLANERKYLASLPSDSEIDVILAAIDKTLAGLQK